MAQLLESTRNYLKTSTKIGRRMSQYKDETSGSQASLQSNPSDAGPPADTLADIKSQDTTTHRPSSKKRLSGLFTFDRYSKNSMPEERPVTNIVSRKISPDSQETEEQHRDTKSSERIHRSRKSRIDTKDRESSSSSNPYDMDYASDHMENEIPRGRSPALSMSNTLSTATSSYDMRPSDYPSMRHYQAHVWRRNLLEESIMHSLKLGYAERQRPDRLPAKKDSTRVRKAREQAIVAAATGQEHHPSPLTGVDPGKQEPHENIIDKTLRMISENRNTQAGHQHHKNSPYQTDHNASMANITHSTCSFTLELPHHHASHVMNSSATPDLFKIKTAAPPVPLRSARRNSKTSHVGGVAPSPRVLTGKRPAPPVQPIILPIVPPKLKDEDEDAETPLTPSSAIWASSVVASLNEVGEEQAASTDDQPKTPETTPVQAM
ncbi:hypothetical protein BGX34_004516 [Mortierella sp. NVP85]|nr:hypothetical protein BGX34_004516 [Mortierella sp. NVP85]